MGAVPEMPEARRHVARMRRNRWSRARRRPSLHLELRTEDHRLEQFLRRKPARATRSDCGGRAGAGHRPDVAAGASSRGTAPDSRPRSAGQGRGQPLNLLMRKTEENIMSEATLPSAQDIEARLRRGQFHEWLGLTVVSVSEGEIELRATWREEWVVNPDKGYTHGGILAALVDLAADWALVSKTGRGVPTIDLRVDYHRAAFQGDLTVKGKVIKFGSQVSVSEAQVFDKDGKLVASGRGAYSTATATASAAPTPASARP